MRQVRVIAGRFRLGKVISHHTYGTIYEAQQLPDRNGMLALEFIPSRISDPQERVSAVQRFLREGYIYTVLTALGGHTVLPQVTGSFVLGNLKLNRERYYVVQEIVTGEKQEASSARQWDEPQLLAWSRQLCATLHFLHQQHPPLLGIVRSPDQLIRCSDGRISLATASTLDPPPFILLSPVIDLLAQTHSPASPAPAPQPKSAKGNELDYIAPEQCLLPGNGEQPPLPVQSTATDIYTLGAILYRLATGTAPANPIQRLLALSENTPDPLIVPRQLNPVLSIEFERLLLESLSIGFAYRPPSAAALASSLELLAQRIRLSPLAGATTPQAPPPCLVCGRGPASPEAFCSTCGVRLPSSTTDELASALAADIYIHPDRDVKAAAPAAASSKKNTRILFGRPVLRHWAGELRKKIAHIQARQTIKPVARAALLLIILGILGFGVPAFTPCWIQLCSPPALQPQSQTVEQLFAAHPPEQHQILLQSQIISPGLAGAGTATTSSPVTTPAPREVTKQPVSQLAWEPHGKWLAIVTKVGIVIWESNRAIQMLLADTSDVTTVAWSPLAGDTSGELISGSATGVVARWTIPKTTDELSPTQGSRQTYYQTSAPVTSLAWSPDGKELAVLSPGNLTLLDAQDGHVQRSQTVANGSGPLAWSPDSASIALGTAQGTLSIYDRTTADIHRDYSLAKEALTGLSWQPGNPTIAVITISGSLLLLNMSSNQEAQPVRSETGTTFSAAAWTPQGHWLGTATTNGTVQIHDRITDRLLFTTTLQHAGVALAWATDGSQLAVGSTDGTLTTWSIPPENLLFRLTHLGGTVRSIAWAPAKQTLAFTGTAGTWLWQTSLPFQQSQVPSTNSPGILPAQLLDRTPGSAAAWAPDGRTLAITQDGQIVVTDGVERSSASGPDGTPSPKPVALLGGGRLSAAVWARSGDLVAAGQDGKVLFWESHSGQLRGAIGIPYGQIRSLEWSPDGRDLAITSAAGTIVIWDTVKQQPVHFLGAVSQGLQTGRWSPDGSRLASIGNDGTVIIWNVDTTHPLISTKAGSAAVNPALLAWSADGQRLAFYRNSATPQVVFFDIRSGQEKGYYSLPGPATSLSWSADGAFLAVAAADEINLFTKGEI